MDGQKGILGQAYEANLRARGVVSEPSDTASTYLRNVGIDPKVDTRTPAEKFLAGLDYYIPPTQVNAPPPPGSNPAAMTGENPTFWEYAAGIGDALVSSAASSTDQIQEALFKYAHDFMLNRNIPLWDRDDKYRAEIDGLAAAKYGGDKNKAQQEAWDLFGRKKFEETRARFSALGVTATAFDFATGAQTHKAVNDGLKYAMETTSKRLQNRSPVVQEFWVTHLAGTVGGTSPYLALAVIPGGYGVALSSGGAMLAQSNEAYTQARQKGASFEDALGGGVIAAGPAAFSGVVSKYLIGDKIGETLATFLGRWNKVSGGKLEKMMDSLNSHVAGRLATAGAAEGFQELVEQLFVKFGVAYATDQELLELEGLAKELASAGRGGAEAGVFFRALTEAITKGRARGDKDLSPKVGDEPVFDEETGEMRSLTKLTPEQAARISGSIPTSLAGGIEPEPQRYIDAQFSAMMNPDTKKDAVFVAENSPQPTSTLVSAAAGLQAVKIRGKEAGVNGVVYTQNPTIADALRQMSATEEGVTQAALDQVLYSMGKGKPTSPDAVVVQRKDGEGNVILSRATDIADLAAVTAEFERQIPSGTTAVVSVAEELTQRINARKPDVKQQTIADKYFDQALNERALPRDVPVNELAAIIAAEEKIDIGIATAVARNVRGRLDQGTPVEPQYTKIVTVVPTDPNTWPKDVASQEQATELLRSQQRDYLDQYSAYQAASGLTPEETAQQRLEGVVGGPEAEAQRTARTKEIKTAAKASAERARKDSDRAVGESYRKYQDELREADLRTQAKVLALEKSPDATERDVALAYRELTEQYKLSPQDREAEQKRQEEDYQGLLGKLRAAEAEAEKATEGAAKEQETKALEEYMRQQKAANPDLTERDDQRLRREFLDQYRATPYTERRKEEKESTAQLDKLRAWYKSREADAAQATEQAPAKQRQAALKAFMDEQSSANPDLTQRDIDRLQSQFLQWYDRTPYKERELLEKEGAASRKELSAWYRAREQAAEQEAKSAPAKQRQAALDAYMQEKRAANPDMVERERAQLEREFLKWYDSSPTDLRNREMTESRYDIKRLKQQYEELVAKQDAAEAARKAEIQAEVKRRKEAGELTERQAVAKSSSPPGWAFSLLTLPK